MVLALETIFLCMLLWLFCYLGTGTDEKNIKSLSSYPDEVQRVMKEKDEFKDKIKTVSPWMKLLSNVVMFTVICFIAGIFIREDNFLYNFVAITIMSQSINLFDLLVIDLLWWRNTKRIRFSCLDENKAIYRDPRNHVISFAKGVVAMLIVSLIDGGLLMLF